MLKTTVQATAAVALTHVKLSAGARDHGGDNVVFAAGGEQRGLSVTRRRLREDHARPKRSNRDPASRYRIMIQLRYAIVPETASSSSPCCPSICADGMRTSSWRSRYRS
jgi:hypothetical protein